MRRLLLAAVVVALALSPPPASGDVLGFFCGANTYNDSKNSTFHSNLELLVASLPTKASSSPALFAIAAIGEVPYAVYGLLHCRGDINSSACQSCATAAFGDAQQLCVYHKDASVFYDNCVLRYSEENFLSSSSGSYGGDGLDQNYAEKRSKMNASAPTAVFDAAVAHLLNAVANLAANSSTRYATGVVQVPQQTMVIFGLAQCTPNQAPEDCRECLADVIDWGNKTNPSCSGASSCTVNRLTCGFVYSVSPFFSGRPLVQLPAASSESDRPSQGRKKERVLEITLPIIGAGAAAIVIGVVLYCYCREKSNNTTQQQQQQPPQPPRPGDAILMTDLFDDEEDKKSLQSLAMDLHTLKTATNDFSSDNQLGRGGFGTVYKGELPDNHRVAVKRLSQSSGQGAKELKNEVVSLTKMQHKNLVRIVGFCLEGEETLIVYELVSNGSLDKMIFDAEKRRDLDVLAIIDGIGRGLQYLHEDSNARIVHRDLKATNVLLDQEFKPKISDFGLAKVFPGDDSHESTSHPVGTLGYVAPEFAMSRRYSVKSDVYSFGVLLLEIVTGKANSCTPLISLVWSHWTKGTILDLVDSSYPADKMVRCIHVALLCIQDNPSDRPNMSTVNVLLNSMSAPIGEPSKPLMAMLAPDADTSDTVPARGLLSQIAEIDELEEEELV